MREEVLDLRQPGVSDNNHKRIANLLIRHDRSDQKTHTQGHQLPIAKSVARSMAARDVLAEGGFEPILRAWMRSR